MKERFDEVIYPEIESAPKRYAISKRNNWIIGHSDFIIFYVYNHFGGAFSSLNQAIKHNIKFINLAISD